MPTTVSVSSARTLPVGRPSGGQYSGEPSGSSDMRDLFGKSLSDLNAAAFENAGIAERLTGFRSVFRECRGGHQGC
jgi:hypothetical protein